MPARFHRLVMGLVVGVFSLVFASVALAQLEDGRINLAAHFGGDVLYCVDRDFNPTNQYSDDGFGGMRLLDIDGDVLWFVPAADITAAVEEAQASGGALIGRGDGTYGPALLYTYIDADENPKFIFVGYDEYVKPNSMEFASCNQVGPDDSAPGSGGSGSDDDSSSSSGPLVPPPGPIGYGSDRNIKQGIVAVDPQAILRQVAELPVSEWQYIADESGARHIGPMAQDFQAAFGVGDETMIYMVDANGVNLAATQGLYQLVTEQQSQLDQLRQQNTLALLAVAALTVGLAGAVLLKRRA